MMRERLVSCNELFPRHHCSHGVALRQQQRESRGRKVVHLIETPRKRRANLPSTLSADNVPVGGPLCCDKGSTGGPRDALVAGGGRAALPAEGRNNAGTACETESED